MLLKWRRLSKTRNNHYVPQWYQEGFFEAGRNTLAYLDMKPPQTVLKDGRVIIHKAKFDAPTSRAFQQRDLYSTFFGTSVNDEIERAIRDDYLKQTPGKNEIDSLQWHSTSIHIPSHITQEKALLNAAIVASNLDEIIQHYPVRTTPALNYIASELGFQDKTHYEAAVRKLLLDDASALAFVKSIFGDVVDEVA